MAEEKLSLHTLKRPDSGKAEKPEASVRARWNPTPENMVTGEDVDRLKAAYTKLRRADKEYWDLALKIGEEGAARALGRGPREPKGGKKNGS